MHAATEAGARIVQIRDKSSDTRSLIKEVERCVAVVEAVRGILFVNDRVDVALAAGAHGVHLGDEDMPVGKARELAGDGRLIGASVATLEEAKAAIAAGADYVSVGAIFATQTKLDAGEPVGCERLREIKQGVTVPVAAIGGINRTNLRSVVEVRADMICVVSAITAAEDIVEATRSLVGLIGQRETQRLIDEGGER